MVEQFDFASEAPLGIGERGVQCDQRIVEAPQGIAFQPVLREDRIWRLISIGHPAQLRHIQRAHAIAERRLAAQRPARFHDLQNPFRGAFEAE